MATSRTNGRRYEKRRNPAYTPMSERRAWEKGSTAFRTANEAPTRCHTQFRYHDSQVWSLEIAALDVCGLGAEGDSETVGCVGDVRNAV